MTIDIERVLEILSESLDIPLYLDEHRVCKILINDQLTIQIELDQSHRFLILGSILTELPAGKFRENVLKAALKENYETDFRLGKFAYLPQKTQLFLFEKLPLDYLTEEQVFPFFHELLTKGILWKTHLMRGEIPYHAPQRPLSSNPFGIVS